MEDKLYLLKLGKYFETVRLFASYGLVMEFVVDLINGQAQINHKYSGYTSSDAAMNRFHVYEIAIGQNSSPKAVKRTVLNKKLESMGFARDRFNGWKYEQHG